MASRKRNRALEVKVTSKREDSVIVMSSLQSGEEDVQSVIQRDGVVGGDGVCHYCNDYDDTK